MVVVVVVTVGAKIKPTFPDFTGEKKGGRGGITFNL